MRQITLSLNDTALKDNRIRVSYERSEPNEEWVFVYDREDLDNMVQEMWNHLQHLPFGSTRIPCC